MDTLTNRVLDATISPSFPVDGIAFCATDQGLEVTRDHGATWTRIDFGVSGPARVPITAVTVSPEFAIDGTVMIAIPGGVGRSEDSGVSWSFSMVGEPPPLATCIAFSPRFQTDSTLFLGTLDDGVWRSEDGGRSWDGWNSGLIDLSITALALSPGFEEDGMVFAGAESGLYVSHNRGRRWERTRLSVGDTAIGSLAVTQVGGAALVLAGIEGAGLWQSGDLGGTWVAVDPAADVLLMEVVPGLERVLVLADSILRSFRVGTEGVLAAGASMPVVGDEFMAMMIAGCGEGAWDIVLADAEGELISMDGAVLS